MATKMSNKKVWALTTPKNVTWPVKTNQTVFMSVFYPGYHRAYTFTSGHNNNNINWYLYSAPSKDLTKGAVQVKRP